jgi:hypothetical protein
LTYRFADVEALHCYVVKSAEIIAAEIVEDLQAALAQFAEKSNDLKR